MTTRRIRYIVVVCVMLAVGVALYWRFVLASGQMIDAIQREDLQRISTLASLTVNPNSEAFLVGGFMQCAAACGKPQSMARLRDLGASVNKLDGWGQTPLHIAVKFNQIEAFRWLLANGADPSILDRDGNTIADYINKYVPVPQQETFTNELKKASNKSAQTK